MVLSRVVGNEPHVAVVTSVIDLVNEFVQSSMILSMARDRVHVSWVCFDILDVDLNRQPIHIDNF